MGTDKLKIVVISHDPGASEILAAYVKAHISLAEWKLFAKPASAFEKISKRHGLSVEDISEATLCGSDALFFGTGWQEKVEREFVQEAKQCSIPSFAFLDHWSAYRERFGYPAADWKHNLPDFTVVSDKKAEELAKSFDLPKVLRVKNFYLQEQLAQLANEDVSLTNNLLFLSEPTDSVALKTYQDKNYWGFTQVTALEDILKNFEKFGCTGLHIRLHPLEHQHNYHALLKKFPHIKTQVYPASFYPLEKDILRSKMIIGFDTMALYSAALFNKPLISYLPSHNREFMLPLPSSHQIRDLRDLRPEHLQPMGMTLEQTGMDFASIIKLIEGFNT